MRCVWSAWFLSLFISCLLPATAFAQIRSVVVRIDAADDDLPEHLCVVATERPPLRNPSIVFAQTIADRLNDLAENDVHGDLLSAVQSLRAPHLQNDCGLANDACRPRVALPHDLQTRAFMSCVKNTSPRVVPGRVLVAALSAAGGLPVQVHAQALRGNVVELAAIVMRNPSVDLYFEAAGGHYVSGQVVRLWDRRGTIGLRPLCSVRDISMPTVTGQIGRTHSLSIVASRFVRDPNASPAAAPAEQRLLTCQPSWGPIVRMAIPDQARAISLSLSAG